MTDLELLNLAASHLPAELQALQGAIVRRVEPEQAPQAFPPQAAPAEAAPADEVARNDDEMLLLNEMECLLDTKLSRQPVKGADSVDVAFHEDTLVGLRTIVVQIRNGEVQRKIGQA
jgi:hypothetical protein